LLSQLTPVHKVGTRNTMSGRANVLGIRIAADMADHTSA
jgi:hypothetical protein